MQFFIGRGKLTDIKMNEFIKINIILQLFKSLFIKIKFNIAKFIKRQKYSAHIFFFSQICLFIYKCKLAIDELFYNIKYMY